jgi:HAD superfamily hydrolase (TIGR01549 family)
LWPNLVAMGLCAWIGAYPLSLWFGRTFASACIPVLGTSFRNTALKAIVFDVDGTLYRQSSLRRSMLIRLLRAHRGSPIEGWRTFRSLSAYRRAQEHLRGDLSGDLATAQISRACEQTKIDRASIVRYVERWMEREPLAILRRCVQPGLIDFLHACRGRGLRLAVLSDYPAEAKLRALGIADLFDVILCAQEPEIGVFKPHPRGLIVALTRLGVSNLECLYVGDRADVDALAAEAAGVPCAILARRTTNFLDTYATVRNYQQLQEQLFGQPTPPIGGVIPAQSYR